MKYLNKNSIHIDTLGGDGFILPSHNKMHDTH
jgi:hypothetical protein